LANKKEKYINLSLHNIIGYSMNQKEEAKEKLLVNIITVFGILLIILAVILLFPNPIKEQVSLFISPNQTLYLSSNMFPLQENGSINYRPLIISFNGVPLANGTECISYVQIYPFNYTTQNYHSQPLTINNPVEVAKIYYNLHGIPYYIYYDGSFNNKNLLIPSNSTLLCPSVVKAIRG